MVLGKRFGALHIGEEEEATEEWGLGRIPTPSPSPLSLYFLKHNAKKLNKAKTE